MRYKIKNIEIRSENAAKPGSQTARAVVEWIQRQGRVRSALDLGCGKLRYAKYLAEKCDHLGLVDSRIQIERFQMIENCRTNVKDYASKNWPHAEVYAIEEFWDKPRRKYDLVLCANVISAIPSKKVRTKTLKNVLRILKKTGRFLVVNQYTNSYFNQMINSGKTIHHLDGYILISTRGNYYYGLLPEAKMSKILSGCGFSIIKNWRTEQSAFVLAGAR